MRRIIGFFALAASLLLAPTIVLAQNYTPPATSDLVLISRQNYNGVNGGTQGAVPVQSLFNGTGIGYSSGTGAGCAASQLTSRTTGVTCAGYTGQITMFSAAGSATAASFTVTDSLVKATDVVDINAASGTNSYLVFVTAVSAGSFTVTFYTTGGVATDAPAVNFAVVHAATS